MLQRWIKESCIGRLDWVHLFFNTMKKKKYVDYFSARFKILQKFDDKQIEQYADSIIEYARDQQHYATLFALGIFAGGLFLL
jgi:hypothetical protein